MKKSTVRTIRSLKGKRPVVAITAYDASTAHFVDAAGVDVILIGDTLGITQLGHPNTVPVTMEDMIHHTAAVARSQPNALVVADLPFAVAHESWDRLLDACRQLVQEAGAEAVKIEGGVAMAPGIHRLIEAGIPVMGHIGLLPQQVHVLGGYPKAGKTSEDRERLIADAKALDEVGVFAIVGENIAEETAADVANAIGAPLIGIASGPHGDGQIMVCNDILGLTVGPLPPFVKTYADLGAQMTAAVEQYAREVRERTFSQ